MLVRGSDKDTSSQIVTMERGGAFKTPMTYRPELASASKGEASEEDRLRADLGLEGSENPNDFGIDDNFVEGEDEDDDYPASVASSTSTSTHSSANEAHLTQEIRRHEKTKKELTQRMKRYELERNSLRLEMDKMKQASRTHAKMLKKGHEQVLADQRKLIQNLEDMVSEQEQANGMDGKKGTAVSLQRLVEQISSLHKDKTSLIEDNVELQQKVQEAEQDLEKEKIHLQGRMDKLKIKLENARAAAAEGETNGQVASDPAEVRELQEEVAQLRGTLEASKKQASTNGETSKQLKDLQAKNEALQIQLRETQERSKSKASDAESHLQAKLAEAASANTRLEAQLRSAQEDKATSKKSLGDLQKKVLQLEAVNSELEAQSRERGKHQGSIEDELMKTRLERKNLEVEVSTLTAEFSQLQTVITDMEASEKQLQDERRQLQTQLVDHKKVSASLSDARTEIGQYSKQVVDLKMDVKKLQDDLHREKEAAVTEKARAVAETEKRIRSEMAGVEKRITAMVKIVGTVQRDLAQVKAARQGIRQEVLALQQAAGPGIRAMRKKITSAISEIDQKNKELVHKYKKEMALRKKYHNEIVELKGNIRVFARVRPTIKEDGVGAQAEHVVTFDDDDDCLLSVGHRGNLKTFEMDKVFQPGSTQEQVFNELKALLVSCVDGYNVCIFAYGQTGSGKTFTMEGYSGSPGINPRALQELFAVTEDRIKEWDYAITVSVMEIYNESIRDLLSDTPTESKEVKQSRNAADGHYVPGLTWIRVQTVDDVNEVFTLGKANRATAVTDMNEHSSRSHALLCIMVVGTNRTTGVRTLGRLNLVDLAGSERITKSGSEGQRLKEAQNINKSLSALGDVIHSLKSKSSHIPYRNSKLTYLLQDSLGGDSKTLMMVQVSPVEKNSSETLCSLVFAQRVKSVELGQASRRTEASDRGDGGNRGSPASGKRVAAVGARKR